MVLSLYVSFAYARIAFFPLFIRMRARRYPERPYTRVIIIPATRNVRLAVTLTSQLNVYYCCEQDDKSASTSSPFCASCFRNIWIGSSFFHRSLFHRTARRVDRCETARSRETETEDCGGIGEILIRRRASNEKAAGTKRSRCTEKRWSKKGSGRDGASSDFWRRDASRHCRVEHIFMENYDEIFERPSAKATRRPCAVRNRKTLTAASYELADSLARRWYGRVDNFLRQKKRRRAKNRTRWK